jgi:tetratricopeptide (TPR) repeat protein
MTTSKIRGSSVMGRRLHQLLVSVLALFGLLLLNGLYLATITGLEWTDERIYQDRLYQWMFLAHLLLGLTLLPPALAFGALHLHKAWRNRNRRAVRLGLGLFVFSLLLLISGLLLVRFDLFHLRDPLIRASLYWLHLIGGLPVIGLFVLHRRAGRRLKWRVGAGWGLATGVVLLATLAMPSLDQQSADIPLADIERPFAPALLQVSGAQHIAPDALMRDGYCQECHADVHRQWAESAHRFSSFNNPAYRASVQETMDEMRNRYGDTKQARLCAGCHDLVPLLSGRFDRADFDPDTDTSAQAGLTCTVCHAISAVNSPRGNADFTITPPRHYPFVDSDNTLLSWLNRQLIKAKPAFHKHTFLKPVHRSAEFCSGCHKVHLPQSFNGYKWLRGQNHYDSFGLSGVSGRGASSFYYPPTALKKCAQCHMPLEASDDFGAARFDDSDVLTVHSHLFPAANTALPYWRGAPAWVNESHRNFMQRALRVDLFGIKQNGEITGALSAPLRPVAPVLEPGQRYLFEIVLRTIGMGHAFTEGTADSNQVWIELIVRAGDRIIAHSGAMDETGRVDPWAYFLNAYVLDHQAGRIDRRNAQDILTPLYNHQIPPGAADVVHYALDLPLDITGTVEVEVRVNYRKFDTTYLRFIQGDDFKDNDLPITLLASDQIRFNTAAGQQDTAAATPAIATWERWNDYGIGLLRKGRLGELRQAETAFKQVELSGRGDGPVNLARVYLKEGRLEEAAMALHRSLSATPPAPPWLVTWLTGQVNEQNGFLDEAIEDYRRVLRSDFPEAKARGMDFGRDYRVLNALGRSLFERARMERGPTNRSQHDALLREAADTFFRTLALDPENSTAHFNLDLILRTLGEADQAAAHARLYQRFRHDDNAWERVVARHRSLNPAADHAAEAVAIYELKLPLPTAAAAQPAP